MPHIFRRWAAERLAARFRPTVAKTQSQQFFIASWLLLHGNMGPTSQNATTNRFGDRKPNNLIKTSLWQEWVWVARIERGQQIWVQKIYGEKSFESITDSQLKHRPWRSSWILTPNSIIYPYQLSAVALLLNKPYVRGLSSKFPLSSVLRTCIWFICLVPCSVFWHDKFWTSLWAEGNQFHVMSSWLLSNCLRTLLRNVSHQEQVNLSTGLIHRTVKAAGLCQHKVHCQCANHFPYTMPSLQTGHQHNLVDLHGFNLRCVKKAHWWHGKSSCAAS